MRKVLVSIICVLLFVTPALGDSYKIGGNDYNTFNQNPTATATGGTATIQKGAVENRNDNNIGNGLNNFSPSASAKIEKGAVENTNVGINMNKNTNIGVNKQAQGQLQGQGQMQNNKQVIAPSQEITIINPENKRDLPNIPGYQAPQQIEFRGPYEKGVAGKVKPWTLFASVTEEQLNDWASAFDSAECKLYTLKKQEGEKAASLSTKKSDGAVLAIIECTATSDFELFADAGKKALGAGGKNIEEMAYAITYLNKSTGWNIGLGGGVTAINGGNDNYGGAVGSGTGYGSVKTEPIAKITAIFAVK